MKNPASVFLFVDIFSIFLSSDRGIGMSQTNDSVETANLNFLDRNQVSMIDEALTALGEYGEVRLIVERRQLRFIVTQRSFDALKWRPGAIGNGPK